MSDLPTGILLNTAYKFYGVDNHCFKIGSKVLEVLEDESDGYRSCLGSVEIKDPKDLNFFRTSIDTVIIVSVEIKDGFYGYELRSTADNHVWLRFGTDHADDYYPSFVFNYEPRPPRVNVENPKPLPAVVSPEDQRRGCTWCGDSGEVGPEGDKYQCPCPAGQILWYKARNSVMEEKLKDIDSRVNSAVDEALKEALEVFNTVARKRLGLT